MNTINMYYEDKLAFARFVEQHSHILFSRSSSILVQVFCGHSAPKYIKELVADIAFRLPSAAIIGATTYGGIMDGQVSGLKTVLSITVFQHAVICGACFPKGNEDEYDIGRQIAALGSEKAKALILFGAGANMRFERVLKGIEEARPELIVAGGSAGHNDENYPAFVFYSQELVECGFAGLVIEGDDLTVRQYSHLGWQAIGQEMPITEVMGNRVYTINERPAYQIYQHYLGIDKKSRYFSAMEFPLIVNRNGFLMAIAPKNCNEDDSIDFFGEVYPEEKVRLGFGNAEMILEKVDDLCQEITKSDVESIFVYSCECRLGFFRDLADMETQPLQKIAPTAGFFTTGEYYHSQGKNQLLNSTMTVLMLAESGDERIYSDLIAGKVHDANCAFASENINARSTEALKALAHLVNTVTAELEAANQELNYAGMHDSLTGIYNRTFFDQTMKRLELVDSSVGIIICDLDSLKLVNDTLGHKSGDRIIRQLARIMQESCRKEDIVARIGGDEFVLIVPEAPEATIADICQRIQSGVLKYRESDSLIYVSVGFSYRVKGSVRSLREVFSLADNAMYRYKKAHKDKVQQEIMQSIAQISLP
ncbi:MAG: GGDEF domain-containing protein [Pelosinus sp.]|nr:GGDEF domain-containing protein [Pelosinus sp.]